jgi:hypothetical protein
MGGWVGHRAGVDDMEKLKFLTLPGLELRPLDRPACSQLLYRLCYRGSVIMGNRGIYLNMAGHNIQILQIKFMDVNEKCTV